MHSDNNKHLIWRGLLGWAFLFLPALLESISAPAIGLWLASVFLFWAFILWRPALVFALLFLLIIGTVNVVHIGFFGNLADQIFLATAQRTNWEETREFIGVLPWKWVAVAALWLVAGIYASVQVWKFALLLKRPSWVWKIALLGLTIWVVFMAFALAKRYSFEEVARKLKTIYPMHIVRAWTAQQQLTEQLFYTPKLPSTTAQAPQVDTLVVVIGESASAERWSLLGYQQADTNGALAEMQNLQVVRAMAHGLNTAAALPYLLTGMSAQQSVRDLAPSFLDIAQHAGYKTFVLSNSRYHSSVEDFYGVTFRRAADTFVKVGNGDWDEVLTAPLEAALHDPAPKKLIVLHTYGSHFQVQERYPRSAARFADVYDNSLRYTSDLLVQWIQDIEQSTTQQQTAMLIYSSDHGVAMPPCADHYRTGSGLSSLQVPLLVWSNLALSAPKVALPHFADNEREHLVRSNAEVADIAVAALGFPGALKPSQSRELSFNGLDWTELQQRDACSLQ